MEENCINGVQEENVNFSNQFEEQTKNAEHFTIFLGVICICVGEEGESS